MILEEKCDVCLCLYGTRGIKNMPGEAKRGIDFKTPNKYVIEGRNG
jgi:hypothetical protein